MNRVRRAGWNQSYISHGARHPGIALVDAVAMLVELQAAIEMRPLFDRPAPAVFHIAAVEDRPPLVVDRFKLDPHIERINGAAWKEVPDLARADDQIEP